MSDLTPAEQAAAAAMKTLLDAAWDHQPGNGITWEEAARAAVAAAQPIIAAKALEDMADRIDDGPTFPLPPSVISTLVRERAADIRAESEGPKADA